MLLLPPCHIIRALWMTEFPQLRHSVILLFWRVGVGCLKFMKRNHREHPVMPYIELLIFEQFLRFLLFHEIISFTTLFSQWQTTLPEFEFSIVECRMPTPPHPHPGSPQNCLQNCQALSAV